MLRSGPGLRYHDSGAYVESPLRSSPVNDKIHSKEQIERNRQLLHAYLKLLIAYNIRSTNQVAAFFFIVYFTDFYYYYKGYSSLLCFVFTLFRLANQFQSHLQQ